MDEGRLVSRDGTRLSWRSWVPERPRAAVAVVHGLAEHAGRYDHVGRHLADRGFAVYALDYRGHGKSEGRRVHVASFDEYLDDVAALRGLVKDRHPMLPHFLLGHSQGGLIVLLLVLRQPEGVDGALVSSPLLGVHPAARPGRIMRALAALLERVAPALIVPNPLDARILSHDPMIAASYDADPLVSHAVSAGWFAALRRAQGEVNDAASRLRTPTLIMSSGDDRLVDPSAAAAWAAAAPASLVEYVRWDGLFHEMLNEPPERRAPVLARIDAWLDARLLPAPG
jgi:acylglycerol lipase